MLTVAVGPAPSDCRPVADRLRGESGTVLAVLEADYLSATRAAYDTVARDYARLLAGALDRIPWDRAVLATFAELVARDELGPVADVGCGPGRITGHLHHLGLDVSGIDLSPGMLAVARQALPGLRFAVGSMTALDLPDASLGGLVAWYSLIHIPPVDVPAVLAELSRVLVPGGQLLLAFQVGDECRHLEQRLLHFQHRYNQTARPFDWRYTRRDLNNYLARLAAHESLAA